MGSMGGCSSLAYKKILRFTFYWKYAHFSFWTEFCEMKGSYADKARFLRFVLGECGKSV